MKKRQEKVTKLSAYALPIKGPGGMLADHTYVVSSEGDTWGCFGRTKGRRKQLIAQGAGEVHIALCLSRQDSTAEIDYGRKGVCHQAANRILYTAGVTVSRAQGFFASAFIFGVYGLGPWGALKRCRTTHTYMHAPPLPAARKASKADKHDDFATCVVALQEERLTPVDRDNEELDAIITLFLPKYRGDIELLRKMRIQARKELQKLWKERGTATNEEFAHDLNEAINSELHKAFMEERRCNVVVASSLPPKLPSRDGVGHERRQP